MITQIMIHIGILLRAGGRCSMMSVGAAVSVCARLLLEAVVRNALLMEWKILELVEIAVQNLPVAHLVSCLMKAK